MGILLARWWVAGGGEILDLGKDVLFVEFQVEKVGKIFFLHIRKYIKMFALLLIQYTYYKNEVKMGRTEVIGSILKPILIGK